MKAPFFFALLFPALFALAGCDRLAPPSESKTKLDTHSLTIIDSSGGPGGGTSGGSREADGTETHTYESANGRYKILLENGVLRINGARYVLTKPGSTIRIVDNLVEIDGVNASPTAEP